MKSRKKGRTVEAIQEEFVSTVDRERKAALRDEYLAALGLKRELRFRDNFEEADEKGKGSAQRIRTIIQKINRTDYRLGSEGYVMRYREGLPTVPVKQGSRLGSVSGAGMQTVVTKARGGQSSRTIDVNYVWSGESDRQVCLASERKVKAELADHRSLAAQYDAICAKHYAILDAGGFIG